MEKLFIQEEDLLLDAYRLGVKIYESGFRPTFIVGVWRGGTSVGIAVQECLQYLGVETDHISVRTSYRGMTSYKAMLDNAKAIRVHSTLTSRGMLRLVRWANRLITAWTFRPEL